MKRYLKEYKYSIIWMIIMLIGCTMKFGDDLPKEPLIPYQDKFVHFGIFGLMGFLVTWEKKHADLKTLALCALYGILIEIIQSFLPWRSFEVLDMVFDTLGAGAGIMSAKWLCKNRID